MVCMWCSLEVDIVVASLLEVLLMASNNSMRGKETFLQSRQTVERANRTGLNFSIIYITRRPNCKIDKPSFINKISRVLETQSAISYFS